MYGVAGFSVWVVVGILWTFCSAFAVVLYPLWESRAALVMIMKGMVKVGTRFRDVMKCLLTLGSDRMFVSRGPVHTLRLRVRRWLLRNV